MKKKSKSNPPVKLTPFERLSGEALFEIHDDLGMLMVGMGVLLANANNEKLSKHFAKRAGQILKEMKFREKLASRARSNNRRVK